MLTAFLALLQDPATTSATPAAGSAPATGTATPAASGGGSDMLMNLLPLVAIGAVFYFVLIGPERKNRKKREAMLKEMKKGDRVMTSGGMYATIAAIQNDEITLQVADGVRVRFSRSAIQQVLPDEPTAPSGKH